MTPGQSSFAFVLHRRVKLGQCESSALPPRLQAVQLTILGVYEGKIQFPAQRELSVGWTELQALFLALDSGEQQLKRGSGFLECTFAGDLYSSLQGASG